MHRDEGHQDDEGKPVKNYHAHIEFVGLDQDGYSVRRKLSKAMLSQMQTDIAVILKMKRGTNYAKERKPRPQRLDSYQYKKAKELESQARARAEAQAQAKIKDLKEEVAKVRAALQSAGAVRSDYAELEQINRELKEKIKSKDLTIVELKAQIFELIAELFEPKEAQEAQETVSIQEPPPKTDHYYLKEDLEVIKSRLSNYDKIAIEGLEKGFKKQKEWIESQSMPREEKQLKTLNKAISRKKMKR
jgi:serine phosphatase RsbU (regulator of sigma subunit)